MAVFIGGCSRYLYEKNFEYYLRAFGLFILASACMAFFLIVYGKNPYVYTVLMLIIVMPVLYYLRGKSYFFIRKSRAYERGIKGEDTLKVELMALSNDYTVFQNLHLPGKRANIDFVVVGPTGIFVIEAKNVHGGTIFTKRFNISETSNEYWGLHEYLNRTLNTRLFVTPIIAFSSYDGIRNLGFSPSSENIHTMVMKAVVPFIRSQSIQTLPVSADRLISAIREITE